MDAIKLLARNVFYLSFQSFKEKYDNYRDDHVLFKHLTRASGTMDLRMSDLKIWLSLQLEYQPKVKKIIQQVLDEINEMNPKIPDGSERKIELILKT
jgi:membrane peptidoglycan carboxypeptidase